MKSSQSASTTNLGLRILVVDDDPTALIFLEGILQGEGLQVTTATNVDEACSLLHENKTASFYCVVTDCLMPGKTGIDLLHWVYARDTALAMVMITAGTERRLAAESLRGGACDFLEKPVAAAALASAVHRAIGLTRERRLSAESREAVKGVGAYQHRKLIASAAGSEKGMLEVFFRPQNEAGGDFLSHFRIGENADTYLLTDVSGHDLRAAFLSAYFQGMVRGMMEQSAPMSEVFKYFNRCLFDEWKDAGSKDEGLSLCASVSACSVRVDRAAGILELVNCGSPLPVCVDHEGKFELAGSAENYPLGWFEENPVACIKRPLPFGGSVLFWTDGVEVLAEKRKVGALAMASVLLMSQQGLYPSLHLAEAEDDILVARILLPEKGPAPRKNFMPLLLENYPGDSATRIDRMQASWDATLRFCFPAISEECCYALLLATREAVLNALKHGCGGHPECSARLLISYEPAARIIRVVVQDPGSGHEFDVATHAAAAGQELIEEHRGLILIGHLCDQLLVERAGARLIMNFSLNRIWS